jgi:hypothetical protein
MSGKSLSKGHKGFFRNRVRPSIVSHQEPACSICGFRAEERRLIHADEVWGFPGTPLVVLIEIRRLCVYCHYAKDYYNLLLRVLLGIAGARLAGRVQAHYCKVNFCTDEEFDDDYKAALEKMRELEVIYGHDWDNLEVDYGEWTPPPRSRSAPLSREETDVLLETIRIRRRAEKAR